MDTSEQYIKMSDCPEIQSQKYTCEYGYHKNFDGHRYVIFNKEKTVWLPRQDQIQKMIGADDKNTSFENWISKLLSFIKYHPQWDINLPNGYKTIGFFETFEQIWLGLYMAEKHKKKWDGEKWHSN